MIRFAALNKAALDATRVSADDEVVRYGDHIEGLVGGLGDGDAGGEPPVAEHYAGRVYVDMGQGLVFDLKPKTEFLPIFDLGEPVTTGDSELVTGGMEQG